MRLAPSTTRAGHPNQARQREAAAAQMRRDASALQLQEALAHKGVDDIQEALMAAESDGVDAATLSTAREKVTRAAREERAKASQETGQTAVTVEAEEEDRRKKEGAAKVNAPNIARERFEIYRRTRLGVPPCHALWSRIMTLPAGTGLVVASFIQRGSSSRDGMSSLDF